MTGQKGQLLGADDFRRLHDAGVSALAIVTEAAAVYLYQSWNRHKYQDETAEDVAMSLAVLGLAPLEKVTRYRGDGSQVQVRKRIRSGPRKKVGKTLKAHLLPFLANLKSTIEANRDAAFTTREAMLSPLIYPATLIPNTNHPKGTLTNV